MKDTNDHQSDERFSLAEWARSIKWSALQEMLQQDARTGSISFALGLPAVELFPTKALAQAVAQVMSTNPAALQYGAPCEKLKTQIARLMSERGVACRKEQIFLCAGAQQGMSLLARLLLDPGGQAMMEEMAYTGFQQAIEPFRPLILSVPTDLDAGIEVDRVSSLLKGGARPSFIYVVTEGHNPLAVSISIERRVRLVELARQYKIPIIEDDAYGFLRYGSTCAPPLRALDEQWVLYIGTFSKILAPAFRVGWIVAPEWLMYRLSIVKEASDIDTSTFAQHVVSSYIDQGSLPEHIAELRSEYKRRRDSMLLALGKHFPHGSRWREPNSGLFIWVELPKTIDTTELLKVASETERVTFIPGSSFCVNGKTGYSNCLRLNFSNSSPERIEEGIERLSRALQAVGA
jgi:2-aminoadipate transaminase